MEREQAPAIEAFGVREHFGPKTLYSYEDLTLGTAFPVLRHHDNGGIEIVSRLACSSAQALDISGQGRTGSGGSVLWRLSENVCDFRSVVLEPVTFVATPTREAGRFPVPTPFAPPSCSILTAEYEIATAGTDLMVTVASWNGNCEPVGGVRFSYRARIQVGVRID